MTEKRPELNEDISVKDFNDFYWLKSDLVSFCKKHEIDHSGGKIDIAGRIIYFLETKQRPERQKIASRKPESKFDWNNETLTLETAITVNYKNTENVRLFFVTKIGNHFKFNVLFMAWMKQNIGKNLKDAVDEWDRIYLLKKGGDYKSRIAPQFEYNMYIRDFLEDNPGLAIDDARKYWALKKETRGSKRYRREDLQSR